MNKIVDTKRIQDFLEEAAQFQLGDLPTEASHPLTAELSVLAQNHLPEAISLFKKVEILALQNLGNSIREIEELSRSILSCLHAGGRIFFCGCGATGRLSISLESNWRESVAKLESDHGLSEKVFGFIAGGDYALVKSIENFEDHPEYGARQLLDLGFGENDLLISCSEGGETPFVIGASLKAAEISKYPGYFLFCNPKSSLAKIARSAELFKNPKIRSYSFISGPQAICGSTRLQASSNLYFACGLALFTAQKQFLNQASLTVADQLQNYIQFLENVDLHPLQNLIQIESQAYTQKNFLTYHLHEYSISILTDLTERSPTFNLLPVENKFEKQAAAATANLCIDQAQSSTEAWHEILKRPIRALNWPELHSRFDEKMLLGFDFSRAPQTFRETLTLGHLHTHIEMSTSENQLSFRNLSSSQDRERICTFEMPSFKLEQNLFLKLIFNLTSTLTQCLNQRVRGNMMLFVKPSNKKLIDRAARFSGQILLDNYGILANYSRLIECVFEASVDLGTEESVVLKCVEIFLATTAKS